MVKVQVPGPLSGTATSLSEALSVPATAAFVALVPCVGACAGTVVVVGAADPLLAGSVVGGVVSGTVVVTVLTVVVVCAMLVVDCIGAVVVVVDSGRAPPEFDPRVKTRTSSSTGLDHISTCVALSGVRRDMVIEE